MSQSVADMSHYVAEMSHFGRTDVARMSHGKGRGAVEHGLDVPIRFKTFHSLLGLSALKTLVVNER
jgi:hypothetical protein